MASLTRIAAGILIAIALLLGVFAWSLSRHPSKPPAALVQNYPIVVATRALPAGKPIPADALRVQSMPVNPNGAFSEPASLIGRTPSTDIAASSPVFEAQLLTGLAERLRAGERAVAVRVDETNAVGDRVKPGNYVDVFFTLKREGSATVNSGAEIEQTQARLLMSKVRVLAFGDQPDPGKPDASSERNANRNPRSLTNAPRTAVLAVPVTDIDKLTLAETAGRLVFALRNPNDDDVIDPAAFPPYGAVVKTSAHSGGLQGKGAGNDNRNTDDASAADASTRAAAGVSLSDLSGATGIGSIKSMPSRPQPPRPRMTPGARPVVTAQSGGSIEVIRGGRAETVAW